MHNLGKMENGTARILNLRPGTPDIGPDTRGKHQVDISSRRKHVRVMLLLPGKMLALSNQLIQLGIDSGKINYPVVWHSIPP